MRRNPTRWRNIESRLGREMTMWLATVRADGRPHLVPLWFIWLENKVYVATGTHTQKFLNLRTNQNVSLSLPATDNVLMIEGEAHLVTDYKVEEAIADYFFNKYEWDFRYDESAKWKLVEITPFKMLVWGDGFDREGTRVL